MKNIIIYAYIGLQSAIQLPFYLAGCIVRLVVKWTVIPLLVGCGIASYKITRHVEDKSN
jgi:hypothetical protein